MKDNERESVLAQAADQREHQRLMALINSEREHAQREIEGMTAQA